jgi:hypothetical protein
MALRTRHRGGDLAAVAAATAVTAFGASARAQWDLHDARTGLEVAAYAGYGAFSNGAIFRRPGATDHGTLLGSFGLQFEAAYRIVPVFSAGLRGTFQLLAVDPSSVPSGTDASANAGALGAYARFHPLALVPVRDRDAPLARADAYVGVGFDFLATVGSSYRAGTLIGTLTVTRATAGVAVPIAFGFEYLVHPNLYVGIMGEWSYWTAASVDGPLGGATVHDTGAHEPESYLFVGVGARGHFNLLH